MSVKLPTETILLDEDMNVIRTVWKKRRCRPIQHMKIERLSCDASDALQVAAYYFKPQLSHPTTK